MSEAIRSDPGRYIRHDIIDKVLLRDLPSLYGINDIQELNSLFTYLAYHSGNELSLWVAENAGNYLGIDLSDGAIGELNTKLRAAGLSDVANRDRLGLSSRSAVFASVGARPWH